MCVRDTKYQAFGKETSWSLRDAIEQILKKNEQIKALNCACIKE